MVAKEVKDRFLKAIKSNFAAAVIVTLTILVDYMLMYAIVPLIPTILWRIHLREEHGEDTQLTTSSPPFKTTQSHLRCLNGTIDTSLMSEEKQFLATQSVRIGLLLASKPAVQIVSNFFIGPLVDTIGNTVPLFSGIIVLCITAVVFAFGQSYAVLLSAVAVQGFGSSCAMSGGMSLIATRYTDDLARGRAIGYVLAALGVGALIGPPYGSIMSTFVGKTITFLILAGVVVVLGIFQLCCTSLKIERNSNTKKTTSVLKLLLDPYISLAAASIMILNVTFGVISVGFASWIITRFQTKKWLIGIAFIPISVSYAIATNIVGFISVPFPRWAVALVGTLVTSIGCLALPFSPSLAVSTGVIILLGAGPGLLEANMFPVLGNLVDSRHHASYGSVYSLADISVCLGFLLGPLLGGAIMKALSFAWAMWILAIVQFVFAPFLVFMRIPPPRRKSEESEALMESGSDETLLSD